MSSTSTVAILNTLRTQMLNFAPAGAGSTLTTQLGGRLYQSAAPDNAVFPYGTMRMVNRIAAGDGDREKCDLEIMLYARTRTGAQDLESSADTIDQALRRYKDSSSGLVFASERSRDSIAQSGEGVDREVVTVRLLYSLVLYPRYLTQYA